jgi:hypothetical protein
METSQAKKTKIQNKDDVEKKCVPTPNCQSIITSFLSMRVARMIEKKNMIFFTSTSPRNPITTHRLALLIGKGIQPSILLEVVTILLHGLLRHSENKVNTNKILDAELSSMQQ